MNTSFPHITYDIRLSIMPIYTISNRNTRNHSAMARMIRILFFERHAYTCFNVLRNGVRARYDCHINAVSLLLCRSILPLRGGPVRCLSGCISDRHVRSQPCLWHGIYVTNANMGTSAIRSFVLSG